MATAGQIWHSARSKFEASRGAGGTPDTKLIFQTMTHAQNVADITSTRLSASYEDMYDHAAGTETNEFNFTGLVDYNQLALWGKLFFKGGATGVASTGTITSSSVASPTVITASAAHNLATGDSTTIAGHTGSTPAISGAYVVTVLTATTFTIPVNVTVGGSGGTFTKGDKIWAFLPVHTSDELGSLLIQAGMVDALSATQPGVSVPYCVGEEFTLGWTKEATSPGITFGARLVSPKAATDITVFTGTAPEPSLKLASHVNTQVYIDDATAGTTADNYVTGVTFTLNNNWVNLFSLNATTAAQDTFRPKAVTWTAEITRYYFNNTERAKYKSKGERAVRIRTTGDVLGASNYRADLDLYGVWESKTWTDADGLTMEQLTMSRKYSASAATSKNLTLINALATA